MEKKPWLRLVCRLVYLLELEHDCAICGGYENQRKSTVLQHKFEIIILRRYVI